MMASVANEGRNDVYCYGTTALYQSGRYFLDILVGIGIGQNTASNYTFELLKFNFRLCAIASAIRTMVSPVSDNL